ncbi:MAG: class IV adenylate cyclase [Anaerolineae bacterium]|nr:class IV adenylate cyclase [Anaerolineae bacterium]
MNAYTETETKLYCPDLSDVARRLILAGATVTTPRVYERNVRYEDAGETFSANGIVLRLRQDYRARLTYKGPGQVSDGIMQRHEAEVEVSDFDAMHVILQNLGYHPHLIYEKYRTTYELDETEVVLDEMPYGNFVEIEGTAAAIEQVIGKLALGEARRYGHSYTGLFDIVKANLSLSFRDLTFDNFDGIDVPETAFVASES